MSDDSAGSTVWMVCGVCGCVVADEDTHVRYHAGDGGEELS